MSETICLQKESSMKDNFAHLDIDVMVHEAAKKIVPVWPLKTFIASNPLQGFEDEHFDHAVKRSFSTLCCSPINEQEEAVNREMIKWLSLFLDTGQASIDAPYREKGFYAFFCMLSPYDAPLHQYRGGLKSIFEILRKTPQEAIDFCLQYLQISSESHIDFLAQNFAYLSGWSGYIKWLSLWDHQQAFTKQYPINLLEYVAVRLIITTCLYPEISLEINMENIQPGYLQVLKDDEQVYADVFLKNLKHSLENQIHEEAKTDVQLIFCIDVRSEPLRRQIENLGAYETFGFAGFFGLPVRIYDEDNNHFNDCCPVLLKPKFNIHKIYRGASKEKILRKRHQSLLRSCLSAYQQLKYNYATPFQLADVMGPWSGLWMVFKNFFPGQLNYLNSKILEKLIPTEDVELDINGIPKKEQVDYAEVILKLMGLTKNFAKLVVFCGHKSTTTNNPYASALDCGACGGNEGRDNPKILAKILNQPFVREQLRKRGLMIPEDTYFMAALHDTTTDECHLSLNSQIKHQVLIEQLQADLQFAREKNLVYRSGSLKDFWKNVPNKSLNWAEVRPEWGLARNAAFVVGPRNLTKSVDCDGRCFLHSYNWEIDDNGHLLETILTAPMVVAQWINHQYLFSTWNNVIYGSGSKITQNIVGKIGVMQGNGSDLMHGLALQSVNLTDEKAFHQPMRLLTVVFAPRQRVMEIILKNDILQKLFFNEWVHLVVIEPLECVFYQLEQKQWKLVKENLNDESSRK